MPVHNEDIASVFDEIADLLEIEGDNPFRIRAYRNGARTLRELGRDIGTLIERGEDITRLAGIGKKMTIDTRFFATEEAALALTPTAAGIEVGLFSPAEHPHARAVTRRLSDGALLDDRTFNQLDPATPQTWSVSAPGLTVDAVSLMVMAADGTVLVAANPLDSMPPKLSPIVWLPLILKTQP